VVCIKVIEDVVDIADDEGKGFEWTTVGDAFDYRAAEAAVVSEEGVTLGDGIQVLVEEEDGWVLTVFVHVFVLNDISRRIARIIVNPHSD
jgi:hypothetical protein